MKKHWKQLKDPKLNLVLSFPSWNCLNWGLRPPFSNTLLTWAWSWPWGWYQKIPIMFFQRSHWTQYPKFMFRSFKTVETRASRLNFQTLPWVWRWPWGQYQKIPIMHFLRVCTFSKIPIVRLQNCGSQGSRNPFSNTLSPRLALRVVTESTNNVFSKG